MGTRPEQALDTEDTHFTNRHTKRYLTSLVIKEIIKTTMQYHCFPPE